MAEKNNEKFLAYNRATDTVVLSEIKDGKFRELEMVEGFVTVQDIATNRIHDADKGKSLSIYGFFSNATHIAGKILPQSLLMKFWTLSQKF